MSRKDSHKSKVGKSKVVVDLKERRTKRIIFA